jgi:hypothetical protein
MIELNARFAELGIVKVLEMRNPRKCERISREILLTIYSPYFADAEHLGWSAAFGHDQRSSR